MSLRSRLGSWGGRVLARWLPDLSAQEIDDVARFGGKVAKRFPAAVGPAGATESAARALWEKGRYAEAVSYLDRVLQTRRELGDRKGEAVALCYLGLAHQHAGDLDAALRQFDLALPLTEETLEPRDEAVLKWHIGRLYEDRAEAPAALEWLQGSLSMFHGLGDEREQAVREDIRRVAPPAQKRK